MAIFGTHWASLSPTARLAAAGAPPHAATAPDRAVLAASVLLNILGLALPLATLQVYDRVVPNQSFETLFVLTIGLLLVAIVEFMLRALQAMIAAPLAAQYTRDLKRSGLDRVLSTPKDAPTAVRTPTETIERLNAVERYCAFYGGPARLALIDLPFAVLFLGVIALIGGPVVFAPLAVLVLYFISLGAVGSSLQRLSRDREKNDVKSIDFLAELFASIFTIKSYALESMMLRRYERLLSASGDTQRDIVEATGDTQRFSGLFGNLSIAATLAVGGALAIDGQMTIGAVAACSLLAGRTAQPAIRIAKAWTEVQRAAIAAESVSELFKTMRDGAQDREAASGRPAPPRLRIGDHVFTPAPQTGGFVAVIGSDAPGRLRLTERIAGLREEDEADALRIEIAESDPASFRRRDPSATVFVGPDGALFRGTIVENLTLFGRSGGAREAIALANAMGLGAEVKRMPLGFDTEVGASVSEALSANGVKQVSLARALLARPALIVLDDPTEHLDAETAEQLIEALRRQSAESTVVVAGADPRLADDADFRIDLEPSAALAEAPA